MNKPGQGFYKVLAESALRAVRLCQPLRVPASGYERWKELQLNFDASDLFTEVNKIETKEEKKQNPEKVDNEVKQVSEFEKKDIFDPNKIASLIDKSTEKAEEKRKLEEEKRKLEEEKRKIAEAKKKQEEEKRAKEKIKKFFEKKEKKEAETQQNLNFITKIFENKNLINLNCFGIKKNVHFRIFIDDKLKKAVEIYPSGKVMILHTVRSNNDYFVLDLHSVKISSGFYSKEEIIINNFKSQQQRGVSLAPSLSAYIAEYANEEIRYWIINRHTGISQIKPIGTVINDKVIVMDDTNQPTNNYFHLEYMGREKFNCSKKSF